MIKTPADRRRSRRYVLNTDVFVVFHPDYTRLGKLKDVSSGGVAFEYLAFAEQEKVVDVAVDVFSSKPDFFMLKGVSCKVVYDARVRCPNHEWR